MLNLPQKSLRLSVLLLLLVQLALPAQLFVYCVGEDGHSGVELAHNAGHCNFENPETGAHGCCPSGEGAASHLELGHKDDCCTVSHCSDIAFPAHVAVCMTTFKVQPDAQTSVAPGVPLGAHGQLASGAVACWESPPGVHPSINPTVLRL